MNKFREYIETIDKKFLYYSPWKKQNSNSILTNYDYDYLKSNFKFEYNGARNYVRIFIKGQKVLIFKKKIEDKYSYIAEIEYPLKGVMETDYLDSDKTLPGLINKIKRKI